MTRARWLVLVPAVVGVMIIGGWIRQQLRVESGEQPVTEADLQICSAPMRF